MKQDYFNTLTKEIIENNDKEKAIEIIANKLNEKQLSSEKEILTNLDKDKEIERLNNIINELEDILKRDIKACNNKFENMFDRNYRRLILEEKLEQLQELKGNDENE